MVGSESVESDGATEHVSLWLMAHGLWCRCSRINFGIIWRVFVKQSALIIWISYVWGTTLAGLAIHPYQSIRRIVLTKRILLPVTLSPVIGLIGLFVVGRVGSYAFTLGDMGREMMALLLGSTLVGLLMWQGLLLLLVWRFWRAR